LARRLIVGLGNPGKKYEKTRHNIGFRVIEKLIQNLKCKSQSDNSKFKMDFWSTEINRQKVILAKPQTFMNESGSAISRLTHFYKIKPKALIVVYDEIDLPFGEIRMRDKGRSAGHKGVQSIIDALKTENFTRVRIGINRPPENIPAETYVLQNFSKEEEKNLDKIIDDATEKVIELIRN